ncbi:UNVERIFIED_CONTAM: hypothetical protein QO022_42440, partial [Pseudomonas aeruginosa]
TKRIKFMKILTTTTGGEQTIPRHGCSHTPEWSRHKTDHPSVFQAKKHSTRAYGLTSSSQ